MPGCRHLNVIIGGGTGLIGSALRSKLLSKNINVRIISRNPKRSEDLSWNTVRTYGLPEDTDVIVNLAGRNVGEINPKLLLPKVNENFLNEICSSRLETTKMLVKSIPKSTKQFINASATGFYKPNEFRSYTEDDKWIEYNFMSRLVHDWEAACSGPQLNGVRRVFVRIGLVLSKDGGFLSSMQVPYRFGLSGPIGSGQQWISWIHIDDIVGLFYFLIADPAGSCLMDAVNGTAPNPVRQGAFSRALSESLNAPFFGGHILLPSFVVRAMLGRERSSILLEGQRVLPAKAQAAGFQFSYPTLEAALENIFGKRPSPVPTH